MGRHRKRATIDNDVMAEEHLSEEKQAGVVEERLGLTGNVCMDCNARVPANSETCRKCGSSNTRPKKSSYSDA